MDSLVAIYNDIMSKADPRTQDWFLISSPIPTLAVVALYLFVVYKGQDWMKDRLAFNLKPFIVIYNFFLVVLSAYMVIELVLTSWTAPGFSLSCQRMDYSNNTYSVRLASVLWWYYFSKIIELMDTIFFVLRKKNNQISFLHVYHHSTMPLLWWTGLKFVPGGESFFSPTINSFIHVLMYTYYMLSAMGPAMQPYLWWKKYMTTLQLVQFWLIVFKTCYAIYLDCKFPLGYGFALITYCLSHIILFSNFYYHTYTKRARMAVAKKNDAAMDDKVGKQEKVLSSDSSRYDDSNNNFHLNGNGISNNKLNRNGEISRTAKRTKRLD